MMSFPIWGTARRRRDSTNPAESEPKQQTTAEQQTTVEETAASNPVYAQQGRVVAAHRSFVQELAWSQFADEEPPKRRRVYVSVYILVGGSASDTVLSSLTGGGLYHSGIEIEGVEYAFGGGPGCGSGVWRQPPRVLRPNFNFKNAFYKESLDMGMTRPLTSAGLRRVIVDMEREWRQNQYNILTRNWCVAREASQPPRKGPAGRSHTLLA